MDNSKFSPRQYLKARHPEYFSDSTIVGEPILTRSMLENFLSTLTSRSQEKDFETFARRLAQATICPNLLPQTGPTGGGDSKVDSETYPVADSLAMAWYVGAPRDASEERWAFAFSAKKDWKPKAKSDIEKLVQTKRGYTKAFFVSNQYISDKNRSKLEDELSKKHGIDVRILDLMWVLDSVFDGRHENLAIDTMNLEQELRTHIRKGTLDTQRESRLEALENRIQSAAQEDAWTIQHATDCIEVVELARSLDRPRTEVDGMIARAERVAKKRGTAHQKLVCAYTRAWTAFWWHEDFEEFAAAYGVAEGCAVACGNMHHIELLSNLWFILYTHVRAGNIEDLDGDVEKRTRTLTKELQRIIGYQNQPSNALQARSLRLLMRLTMEPSESRPAIFSKLKDVVLTCEGLLGFPLEPLVEILTSVGKSIESDASYDSLFDTILEITSKRSGEIASARLLLRRGVQHLQAKKTYEAIRILGRALVPLFKEETKQELHQALFLLSGAYEEAELWWAARGTLLSATSLAVEELSNESNVTAELVACFNRLKWIEMRLGRLPQLLVVHEIDRGFSQIIGNRDDCPDWLGYDIESFDLALLGLLLRTELSQLCLLSKLPCALNGLGLGNSASGLLYALGHEDDVRELIPVEEGSTVLDFMMECRDHPAKEAVADKPTLYIARNVELESHLLGCRITLTCAVGSPFLELGESILGGLESFFSTGIVDRLLAREPKLEIEVSHDESAGSTFDFEFTDTDGRPKVNIVCARFDPDSVPRDLQTELKEKLLELYVHILARIIMPAGKPDDVIKDLVDTDKAVERAVSFAGSFVALGNVLPKSTRSNLSMWLDKDFPDYPAKRTESWDAHVGKAEQNTHSERGSRTWKVGKGDPPTDLFDESQMKHSQMSVLSLIRETLWDEAKWFATAFYWTSDPSFPPVLAFVFRESDPAKKILQHWYQELGADDVAEKLRLTIVRGFDKSKPHAYRVVVGINPSAIPKDEKQRYLSMISRINTMEPISNTNLDKFLGLYAKAGCYQIGYATVPDGETLPDPNEEFLFTKRELNVRQAWEIGRHDLDMVGIHPDDDPIVPQGRSDIPVFTLLEFLRSR